MCVWHFLLLRWILSQFKNNAAKTTSKSKSSADHAEKDYDEFGIVIVRDANILDWILFALLSVQAPFMLWCKYLTHLSNGVPRVWFILMPCHLLTIPIACCTVWRTRASAVLFQALCHYMIFPVLALTLSDTRDYQLPFEVEGYWIQHGLMVLIPLRELLFARRTLGPLTVRAHLLYWGLFSSLIWHIHLPVGLITSCNMNFMFHPPPGAPLSSALGTMYRPVYTVGFLLMTSLSRLGMCASETVGQHIFAVADPGLPRSRAKKGLKKGLKFA